MLQYIAEFLSIIIFIPCGVIFGFLTFHIFFFDYHNESLKFWPFIAIIITSIIVSGEITITKLIKYKYNITHIYYVFLSSILFLICGCLCFDRENYVAVFYIGAVAIGLAYTPALAYLNIRSSDNYRNRVLKLSISQLCFFIGIASIWTIITFNMHVKPFIQLFENYSTIYREIGILLITISSLLILLFIINEFRNFKDMTKYKISKDEEINMNNKNHTLFNDRLPKIVPTNTTWTSQLSNMNIIDDSDVASTKRQIFVTILLLMYKCRDSIVFNYFILFYGMNFFVQLADNAYLYWFGWIFVAGGLCGCILLLFIGVKVLITISAAISMFALIVLTILVNIKDENNDFIDSISPMFLVFIFAMSMAQCAGNIHLLQMTKFKYTEIIFTCGLVIEITIIFLVHYSSYGYMLTSLPEFNVNNYWILSILIGTCLLLVFIPNVKNLSLISIRNLLLNVKYNTKYYGPGAYLQQPVTSQIQPYGMSMMPQHQLQPNQYQGQINYNYYNNSQMSDLNSLNSNNMMGQPQPQYMPEYSQPIKKNKLQQQRPLTPTAPLPPPQHHQYQNQYQPQQQQQQHQEGYDYQSLPRTIVLPRANIAPVKMAVELDKKY